MTNKTETAEETKAALTQWWIATAGTAKQSDIALQFEAEGLRVPK